MIVVLHRFFRGLGKIHGNVLQTVNTFMVSSSVISMCKDDKSFTTLKRETPTSILYLKAGSRPKIENEGVVIEGMGKTLPSQELEPFTITLEPKAGSGGERQVVHSGHEFVYCLQGKIEYVIDGTVYTVEQGDTLIFEATLPHLWRNPFDEEAKFMLVLQTPNSSREPVQRHFSNTPSVNYIGG